jgi:hypothetical protein
MTKVRVSEETPNLSHSSNLISTVRLENPSPSLMRSIRARGRTHSWVVQAFWREQEREHFRAAREQPFLRARACIPRQQTSTEIEAARTTFKAGRTVRIEQVVQQEEQAQKSRQSTVQQLRPYCTDFEFRTAEKRARISRQESTVRTVRISYGPYDCPFGTDFEQKVLCCFLEVLAHFPRWSYNINCSVFGLRQLA